MRQSALHAHSEIAVPAPPDGGGGCAFGVCAHAVRAKPSARGRVRKLQGAPEIVFTARMVVGCLATALLGLTAQATLRLTVMTVTREVSVLPLSNCGLGRTIFVHLAVARDCLRPCCAEWECATVVYGPSSRGRCWFAGCSHSCGLGRTTLVHPLVLTLSLLRPGPHHPGASLALAAWAAPHWCIWLLH